MPENRLVLLSGGMDSAAVLLAENASDDDRTLTALAFRYGQAHADRELAAAKQIAELLGVPFRTLDLPPLVSQREPGDVIAARNLIFAAAAANICQLMGGGEVLFGCCGEDQEGFPDCRPEFFARLNQTLGAANLEVVVMAPFVNLSKAETLRLCWDTPRFQEVIALSYSCYLGADPCGSCAACVKRAAAFQEAGLPRC